MTSQQPASYHFDTLSKRFGYTNLKAILGEVGKIATNCSEAQFSAESDTVSIRSRYTETETRLLLRPILGHVQDFYKTKNFYKYRDFAIARWAFEWVNKVSLFFKANIVQANRSAGAR